MLCVESFVKFFKCLVYFGIGRLAVATGAAAVY